MEKGMVDVQTVDSAIIIKLAYATENNFTGVKVYDSINHAFLRPKAIAKLKKANEYLQEEKPNHHFVIFDALRPQSVQYKFWDIVKGTDQQKYVASPGAGSVHNFGFAVDLTIADSLGNMLDMGTEFDHFGPKAEYRYNWSLLKEGKLTREQVNNRILLRKIMRKAGFISIDSEWWHFNALPKDITRSEYDIVK